jgi:hypothetical protein
MSGFYSPSFQPMVTPLTKPNPIKKESSGRLRNAFSFAKRTPEQREAKIKTHLNSIDGLAPVLKDMSIAHTGKDISRGLRAAHRARAFGWVTASTGAWIASAGVAAICPPAIIPLTTVAAALSAVAFAEEWRTSERMLHRQKKNELIRSNQGIFHIPTNLNSPSITVIKKTYLTVAQAKKSFKINLERIWKEHPELHTQSTSLINPKGQVPHLAQNLTIQPRSAHSSSEASSEASFEIPFYHKRHRLSIFTPYENAAKELFAQACQQYRELFSQEISDINLQITNGIVSHGQNPFILNG